ncbi:MAG: methyl-accepting chemotaxis protein [Acidobacteria bacterium]|nr:methyl-accepting chemotaxis protein [Acidobacteriota bacterium]
MKLSTKLYLGLSAMTLLAMGANLTQRWLSSRVELTMSAVSDKMERASEIRSAAWEAEAYKRGTYLAASLNQGEMRSRFETGCTRALANLREAVGHLRTGLTTSDEHSLMTEIETVVPTYSGLVTEFIGRTRDGRLSEVPALVSQIVPLVDRLDQLTERMLQLQRAHRVQAVASAASSSTWLFGIVCVLVFGVGGSSIWVVRQSMAQLGVQMAALSAETKEVRQSAFQISAAGDQVAQVASEQAASLEEASASTRQIQSMTRSNLERVESASSRTAEVSASMAQATRYAADMVDSMDAMVGASRKISNIIKVIEGIAFQTNLLALNAAVEAARAGEAGLGFAVVAEEVRLLAQRSSQAAKDTAELIEESLTATQNGKSRLDLVKQAIDDSASKADAVQTLTQDVTASSKDQARAIDQITSAFNQIDVVTQRLAATAQETAVSGSQLNQVSGNASVAVGRVNDLILGRTAA